MNFKNTDVSTLRTTEIKGINNFPKRVREAIVEDAIMSTITDMAKENIQDEHPEIINLTTLNMLDLMDQNTPLYWRWSSEDLEYSGFSLTDFDDHIHENIDVFLSYCVLETQPSDITVDNITCFMELSYKHGAKSKILITKVLKERQEECCS